MNQEQQRIAIAEARGWQEVLWSDLDLISPREARERKVYCRNNAQKRCEWLPDYLNDLNAMHEAEKVLDYNQMNRYQNIELSRFVHTGTTWICSATAAQRAEAFLRTLEKWEDDK